MSAPIRGQVHVVAGAVYDAAGRVLIAERPAGRHLAGGWEFPGGKLGVGEARFDALARELREEIGIRIESARPLIQIRHRYPDRHILLDVWRVTRHAGEPRSLDGQRLRWCGAGELAQVELLPADRPVIAALRLPERLTETRSLIHEIGEPGRGRSGSTGQLQGAWCAGGPAARDAVAAGADFLVLRDVLTAADLSALCDSVNVPVFARGIALQQAWELGATGLNEI